MSNLHDEAHPLLGEWVKVTLDDKVVVMGRLLAFGQDGEFEVETEPGIISYCWPLLSIRPLGFPMWYDPPQVLTEADKERWKAAREMTMLGQDMDTPPRVCLTHKRVYTCRTDEGCVWSEDPEDIQRITAYQQGE